MQAEIEQLKEQIAKLQKVVDAVKVFEKNCYMRDCGLYAISKMHEEGTYKLSNAIKLQNKFCIKNGCYYKIIDQALKELEEN